MRLYEFDEIKRGLPHYVFRFYETNPQINSTYPIIISPTEIRCNDSHRVVFKADVWIAEYEQHCEHIEFNKETGVFRRVKYDAGTTKCRPIMGDLTPFPNYLATIEDFRDQMAQCVATTRVL